MFLGLYCLMQAVGITAPRHNTSGKLVYYHNFVILDNVVLIPEHLIIGFKRVIYMMKQFHIIGIRKVFDFEKLFGLFNALLGQRNALCFFVYNKIALFDKFFFHKRVKRLFLVDNAPFCKRFGEYVRNFISTESTSSIIA